MATTHNPTKPISFFLGYFFNGFFMAKSISDTESSPTSVFDTKQSFTRFGINSFGFEQNRVKPRKIFEEIKIPFEKLELESENGIALALIQENPNDSVRKVMFGSNLKIQIPSHPTSDPFVLANGSPECDCDFGTKTKNISDHLTQTGYGSPRASMDALSLSEMELSEDYTKVISYGSNPKTTHIYDNCVVESCCDVVLQSDPDQNPPRQSFLSFCHTCKKNLEDDCDIFMYRGEKAFCSDECRCQEMILDGFMK